MREIKPFEPPDTEQASRKITGLIVEMQARLHEERAHSIAMTSEDEWERALQCTVILSQIDEKRRERNGLRQFSLRDAGMAANVAWQMA